MSRNGSGTYSIPNTYSDGQAITASIVNGNFSDIATELTNSVAKDGQSTMTGPLKASNGTVAAPSITFGADTDTGLYRKGANNPAIAAGGADVVDITTTGVAVTGTLSATGAASVGGNLTVTGNASVTNLTASGTVTVPDGSVATAAIAADAVTFAKMQNISTGKLLGRTTASSGDIEEITPDSTLTLSGGALSVAAPTKAVLLSTQTASGGSALTFTSLISSDYDEYELHVADLRPGTSAAALDFQVSTDNGSSWKTTGYRSGVFVVTSGGGTGADTGTSGVGMTNNSGVNGPSNSSSYGWRGVVRFWPNGTATRKNVNVQGSYYSAGNGLISVTGAGTWDGGNDAVTAVRIVPGTGTLTGTARLIGIKNS